MKRNLYDEKASGYFDNAREDFVALIPDRPISILELGCGTGSTALLAKRKRQIVNYLGIELNADAANEAKRRGLDVVQSDVEALDLRPFYGKFDVLWASEVLEHLVDPWNVMKELAKCLKPGSLVIVSTPNIAHLSIVMGLVRNRFEYTERGLMDRTHLRWFTSRSLSNLVASADLDVLSVKPSRPLNKRAALFDYVTRGKLRHLLHTQTIVIALKR